MTEEDITKSMCTLYSEAELTKAVRQEAMLKENFTSSWFSSNKIGNRPCFVMKFYKEGRKSFTTKSNPWSSGKIS